MISMVLNEEVANMASHGGHGRSAAAVLANMDRFQRSLVQKSCKMANSWIDLRLARYWAHVLKVCRTPGLQVYGLAMDQTRAGGKDMLYTCLFLPELGQGCWLPPQDSLSDSRNPTQVECNNELWGCAESARRRHAAGTPKEDA